MLKKNPKAPWNIFKSAKNNDFGNGISDDELSPSAHPKQRGQTKEEVVSSVCPDPKNGGNTFSFHDWKCYRSVFFPRRQRRKWQRKRILKFENRYYKIIIIWPGGHSKLV